MDALGDPLLDYLNKKCNPLTTKISSQISYSQRVAVKPKKF